MQAAVQTAIKSCRMIKVSALHLEFQPSLSEGGIGVQLFFLLHQWGRGAIMWCCILVVKFILGFRYYHGLKWDQVERASIAVSMIIPACRADSQNPAAGIPSRMGPPSPFRLYSVSMASSMGGIPWRIQNPTYLGTKDWCIERCKVSPPIKWNHDPYLLYMSVSSLLLSTSLLLTITDTIR